MKNFDMKLLSKTEINTIEGGGPISDFTAWITEALLCGCDLKTPKLEGQTWNEYNNKF